MTTPVRRPREETARLGKEMYQRDILPLVEADHHGEVVAIDVDRGDYALADTALAAVERLRAQRPDAVNILCERVGYPTLRKFGLQSRWGITVLWDGAARFIEADEADTTPLVGMLLLDGHNLNIAVESGGPVVIEALA